VDDIPGAARKAIVAHWKAPMVHKELSQCIRFREMRILVAKETEFALPVMNHVAQCPVSLPFIHVLQEATDNALRSTNVDHSRVLEGIWNSSSRQLHEVSTLRRTICLLEFFHSPVCIGKHDVSWKCCRPPVAHLAAPGPGEIVVGRLKLDTFVRVGRRLPDEHGQEWTVAQCPIQIVCGYLALPNRDAQGFEVLLAVNAEIRHGGRTLGPDAFLEGLEEMLDEGPYHAVNPVPAFLGTTLH
jgi:hypothetical protein